MSTPPPATPGITWRPVRSDDILALVELAAAIDAVEHLEFAGGPDYWTWWIDQHDAAADTMLAVDETGAALGLAGSYGTDSELGARAIVWFDSHPDRLDLEPVLLAWSVQRGKEQVTASPHPDKVIRGTVEEHRSRRRSLFESAGFEIARTFVSMRRSLTDTLPEPRPAPDDISVVAWAPELDEAARLVSNAAFRDHWGSLPFDPDTWHSMVLDDDLVQRDLSFVALADGEAVAICLAEVDPEDDPDSLWISRVGTHPSWQRRGLASLLLTRCLNAGAAAGLSTSALAVDEESRFDATAIYANLGYRVTTRTINYVLGDAS